MRELLHGVSELDLNTVLDIGIELEDALQILVDVVPLETASEKPKYCALTKGVVVLERDDAVEH